MGVIAALSLVVLMLAITLDVITRYITKASIPGVLELAESCLVISIFFGLPIAAVRGEHVAVTLVTDRLNDAWARVCFLVAWAVTALFLAWMTWASITRAIEATERGEERFGLVRWPVWPMRWVIVIGLLGFLAVAIVNLIRLITNKDPLGAKDDVELATSQIAVADETETEAEPETPTPSPTEAPAGDLRKARA
jgi:TRAP-type C4-dicarboxylate transport system permease small subunit